MGQTWCKEKTTKAQDSKSPLDRVFLQCAHRIYPGLKEDGSVLGGATQRVTSSEIGYASSPPRSALTRGHSIDSVDRPFHPNEWVDVNLEVPSTPQLEPARTHLPAANARSASVTSVKYEAPIPPPRRRNKNRGRPLPPKPDEISRSEAELAEDPLYSSVKINYSNPKGPTKETTESVERKVNGTATGDVVSSQPFDKTSFDVKSHCKVGREDERERLFSGRRSAQQQRADVSSAPRNFAVSDAAKRPKNCSTSSLPNYDELDAVVSDSTGLRKGNKFRNNYSTGALHTNPEIERILRENTAVSERGAENDNSISTVVDETHADFADSTERPLKLESTMRTSTPLKDAIGDDSISTKKLDEWFRGQESSSNQQSENYYTTIEDESTDISVKANTQQTLKRTLSNESEPFDCFEEKELTLQLSERPLVRAISEESLPQEMLEDVVDGTDNSEVDFFDAKADMKDSSQSNSKTPPSTPEEKIRADLNMNGGLKRKKLLEVTREDAGSNLSSMTPSLTELEYALSDMLENRDKEEEGRRDATEGEEKSTVQNGSVEPKIVPLENNQVPAIHIPHESRSQLSKNNKSSNSEIEIVGFDFKKKSPQQDHEFKESNNMAMAEQKLTDAPEKPSRMHRGGLEDSITVESVPTPPRRRNRSSSSGAQKDTSASGDRLI